MSDPYLDTNVVVHAFANDSLSNECGAFLEALEADRRRVILDPLVIHELTYALPRYQKQISRQDLSRLLVWLINLPGIACDKPLLGDALFRWSSTAGLGFVDAYLAAKATRENVPVFTKNVRHFLRQGVVAPDPLPGD